MHGMDKQPTTQHRAAASRSEIAAQFGVSVQTVSRWQKQGCPCFYAGAATSGRGARPRFIPEEVKAWLESRTEKEPTDAATGKGVEA